MRRLDDTDIAIIRHKCRESLEKYFIDTSDWCHDRTFGRILIPDGLRFICESYNYDAEAIGQHFLEVLLRRCWYSLYRVLNGSGIAAQRRRSRCSIRPVTVLVLGRNTHIFLFRAICIFIVHFFSTHSSVPMRQARYSMISVPEICTRDSGCAQIGVHADTGKRAVHEPGVRCSPVRSAHLG